MSATKNTDARVAELEAELEAKVADNLARSCADRLLRHGLRARIAALEAQLADRDEEIQRLHKESQMLCDAHVEPLERQLAASREREGRMREALESIADSEDIAMEYPRLHREAAALAAEKENSHE